MGGREEGDGRWMGEWEEEGNRVVQTTGKLLYMCTCSLSPSASLSPSLFLPSLPHSPDGMEIPAERMREYEALDIKVCVCVCACACMCVRVHVCACTRVCSTVYVQRSSYYHPLFLPSPLSQVIEVIKRDILSASTQVPHDFLETLTSILNRGSIHSAADQLEGMSR